MAWIKPTWKCIYQVMAASEVEALGKLQKQPGDILVTDQQEQLVTDKGHVLVTDPPYEDLLTPALNRTVNMVRGYIDTSGRYKLGEDGTIPESLETTMLDIYAIEAWKRLGGDLMDISERRSRAYDDAIDRLKAVARGEFGIAEPTTPSTEERQGFRFSGGQNVETFNL